MVGDIVISAGAVAIIVTSFAFPQWFVRRPFLFLGKISFSLYLTHFAVMKSIEAVPVVGETPILMWMATIAISLLVATMFMVFVEKPPLAASRWVRRSKRPT